MVTHRPRGVEGREVGHRGAARPVTAAVAVGLRCDDGLVPWLARLLVRLLSLLALGALRGAVRTPGTVPPHRPPSTGPRPAPAAPELARRLRELTVLALETARIVGHGLALVAFLSATAVLVTAGTTTLTLGPRWVGGLFLALATATLVTSVVELRAVWRLRLAQVRRRRRRRLGG